MNLGGTQVFNTGGCKAIVTFSPWARLKLGHRYVWVDFHDYCGPTFYHDSKMSKEYRFTEAIEDDPIWPVFEVWHLKYKEAKEKRLKKSQLKLKGN